MKLKMRSYQAPAPPAAPIRTVSIDTIAQRLDVSPWTVRTWLRQGKLPYTKIGRRVLVREKDLAKLLKQHYKLTPPIQPNGRRERNA
jgi:excisionase family DNA binding protein